MPLKLIRQCLAIALELDAVEAEAIDESTTAGDLEKWDSMNHLKLVLELQRRLDVQFDEDEIVQIGSVKAIMDTVEFKRR